MKKLFSSRFARGILRFFFSIFYKKQYLTGYYFDTKLMGWYWAFRTIPRRLAGENKKVPWPVHPRTIVGGPKNIVFDQSSINVFQTPGCYWQAHDASITIGKSCYVAPNVGIITTNHDINNPSKHEAGKPISIGDHCWIGMNAVVLPGVILGEHTVVAAGAVVTHSFPEGYCVVGGVPAKVIKMLDKENVNKADEINV